MVVIDERGRIVLPKEVRRRLGISDKHRILVRVRDDNVIELHILDKLYESVTRTFEEKFRDWKEEEHEASKLLSKMMKNGDN